jgi:NAD(P)-dependent dehydrogenase (short-subunit alcohol dehydrogenase family)
VLPIMRAQACGVVVNVTSVGGLVAAPFFGAYSATKFALDAMTEAMGAELMPFGVRVVSVAPGPYDTPIAQNGIDPPAAHGPDSPYRAEYETVRERHLAAMKLADKPEEVAVAIADAIHDPDAPVRVIVPQAYEFVATSRGQTPPDVLRKALRQNYGLE